MTRRMSAVAVAAALVLALAACSKKEETGGTTGTTATSSTTTEQPTGTTEARSTGTTERKSTGTTEKRSTGTTSKSGGSTKAMKTDTFALTSAENDCLEQQATAAFVDDPTLATNDAKAAGVVGGILVNCVPKPRLATGVVADIKSNPLTATLSSTQEQCIRDEILSANDTDLALFLGVVVYGSETGDQSLAKPFEDALNDACGTNISLDI